MRAASSKCHGSIKLRLLILLLVLGAAAWFFVRKTGMGPTAMVRGPTELHAVHRQLKEGDTVDLTLKNERPRRIVISARSNPKNIAVLTMDDGNFLAWKNAQGLSGGQYKYLAPLSALRTTSTKLDAVLPEGAHHIVIHVPRESVLFLDQVAVDVSVLGY